MNVNLKVVPQISHGVTQVVWIHPLETLTSEPKWCTDKVPDL